MRDVVVLEKPEAFPKSSEQTKSYGGFKMSDSDAGCLWVLE